MGNKFYVLSEDIVPEILKKVIYVKELLHKGEVKDISEGVKTAGLSRSAFYKYRDKVFPVSEGIQCQKATLSLLLHHKTGVLSKILDVMAENGCNLLTISQDMPINDAAYVTITLDISGLKCDMKELLSLLPEEDGVIKAELIAME